MVEYNRYPAMDAENNFPPAVREAFANSPEQAEVVGRQVRPHVSRIIAEDRTLIEAASSALEEELKSAGVVYGRLVYVPDPRLGVDPLRNVGWRQTTKDGQFLPLGYTREGRLDAHAIKIWSEDLEIPVKIPTHPRYAKVITTENNELLLGIRWDGGVDIPGLTGVLDENVTSNSKERLYQDAPYYPGSDIYPAHTDMQAWSGWGSSSMGGINAQITARAKELGVSYYNGGQGGERSDHIAARLGSVPAKLTFPNNIIPASGSVAVASSNMSAHPSLRVYSGWVTGDNGTLVHGKISSTATVITFTRTTDGEEIAISRDGEFIPEEGPKHRGEVAFLWMGKNNINAPDKVLSDTHKSYEYFVPLVKNVIVMGHFMNGDQPAVSATRDNLLRVNAELRARYGRAYFDVQNYLTSPELWADTGLTPTEKDISEQAIGNKPPSVSSDTGHMNTAGYTAVSNRLKAHVLALGWY